MSDAPRIKPVINLDEVEIGDRPQMFQPTGKAAERFSSKMGAVGTHIGAQLLGYNITVVPAGGTVRTRSSTPDRKNCATSRSAP